MTVRLSKDQRNQVFGVLKAESTVNNIAHHFGCSRQTIHYLMNRYNRAGCFRVHARPGQARVTTLRSYRVNTLSHPRNRFKRQQLLLVTQGRRNRGGARGPCRPPNNLHKYAPPPKKKKKKKKKFFFFLKINL